MERSDKQEPVMMKAERKLTKEQAEAIQAAWIAAQEQKTT